MFICILFLVHFSFFFFFEGGGGGGEEAWNRSITGGPWARSGPYKSSIDPIQNGGSMAHDWNLRKGKINH